MFLMASRAGDPSVVMASYSLHVELLQRWRRTGHSQSCAVAGGGGGAGGGDAGQANLDLGTLQMWAYSVVVAQLVASQANTLLAVTLLL